MLTFKDFNKLKNSEMVDHNGDPIVFYHGSKNNFKEFDKNYIGTSTDAGWLGEGFYFYTNFDDAAQYGNVKTYYLNITNPYYATDDDNIRLSELNDKQASHDFTEELKGEGYDGVYYDGNLREETVVFEPEQIFPIN